jgi:DNA polymerase
VKVSFPDLEVEVNPDASPKAIVSLAGAYLKTGSSPVARKLRQELGTMHLDEFRRSGMAVGFYSPLVGGAVWFVADNYSGGIPGAYRIDEILNLAGVSRDGVKAIHAAKTALDGEVVPVTVEGEGSCETAAPAEESWVDLSPRDAGAVSRARIALGRLVGEMVSCRACGLGEGRTRIVPGEGDVAARVMLVGEGPGRQEDVTGRPFIGRAGRLLDELLPLAGLDRKKVYVANTVKCRPVGPDGRDRTPWPEEVAACARFLKAQLLLVSPALVVTLGVTALEWFLPGCRVGESRGRLHRAEGWLVYPTYHPAAALRDEYRRQLMEEDFKRLGEVLWESGPQGAS